MKKLIIALCTFLALSTAAFCEAGGNLDLSAGADCSFMLKPYAYANAGVDYEFDSGFKLGAGARGKFNVLHKQYMNDEELVSEAWAYAMPYLMIGYKGFTVEGGLCISKDFVEFWKTPFIRMGGEAVFGEAGPGTIGMEFGAEFWPSMYLVRPEDVTGDSKELGAGLGSVLGTVFNMVKLSVGAKYRLPL